MNQATPLSCKFIVSHFDTNYGRLMSNLHTLETVIRIFLLIFDKGYKEAVKFNKSVRKLKIGQEVTENAFTNFNLFSKLVTKYNCFVSSRHILYQCKIDSELIDFRNAVSHGRIFYKSLKPPHTTMLLLQFSDPRKDKVSNNPKVEYCGKMTTGWFNKKIQWIAREKQKVEKACWIIKKLRPT
jgi:hypothetical protein